MTSTFKMALASTAALIAGAGVALAQDVTLRAPDGSLDLTGKLLSFEDNVYEVRTILGSIRVNADRVVCEGAGCPADGVETISNEVQLRAKDGSIDLTGNLEDFDGITYKLRTPFGLLEIDAATSDCFGEACPNVRATQTAFGLAAADGLAPTLIDDLMAGYAVHRSADVSVGTTETGPTFGFADASGATFAEIAVARQSATETIGAMIAREADLALSTRGLRADERTALIGETADDLTRAESEAVVALDALAILVHPSNPVRTLARADIARVFAGDISDWSELGGAPGPISLVARDGLSGTGAAFDELVMFPASLAMSAEVETVAADADVAEAILGNPRAIGVTTFSSRGDAPALDITGACGIRTQISDFTIKTEEYPLTRRIYLYQQVEDIPEIAGDFVEYATSEAAQTIVGTAGYVDQSVARHPIAEQAHRLMAAMLPGEAEVSLEELQAMATDLNGATRLSLTYRFESGAAQLDGRALADVRRMAKMIQDGAFEGQEIIVAGFTDSVGLGEINRDLSQAQAEQVMASILAAAGDDAAQGLSISARGYGELAPLVCNDDIADRGINRRIEIWTRDQDDAAKS